MIHSERTFALFYLHLQIRLLFQVQHSLVKRYASYQNGTIDVCNVLKRLIEIVVYVYFAGFSILEKDLIWFEFDQDKISFLELLHLIFIYREQKYNTKTVIFSSKCIYKPRKQMKQIKDTNELGEKLKAFMLLRFKILLKKSQLIVCFQASFYFFLPFLFSMTLFDMLLPKLKIQFFMLFFPALNINQYLPRMNFQLDSIIEVLLCSDNQRRIEAERFIDQVPLNAFEPGIDAFLASMTHENSNVATMGALLLKKKYLDPKETISRIPHETLAGMVTSVKGCMSSGRPVMFLKRCCQILVRIYSFANIKDQLVGVIQQLSCVPETNMKLALMYFIEIICESAFNDQLLLKYSDNLAAIFQTGLDDPNNEVKVAAFKTLTIFLASISDEKAIKKFAKVLDILISKTIQLIKFDQESGMTALQSLNELVEAHPKFIKPIFSNLLMIYAEIMETAGLLVNLRSTAMAGALILCNQHHTSVRKSEYFKKKMVPAYMGMLAEIKEDSLEEWAEELIDEVISKNGIAMSTEEHLAQITNQLGNKFMLPLFVPYITSALASPEPRYQHAGLTALALLVENCHQNFKGELKNMIALMLPLLNSTNPRIIYDVLVAMGYMASEFAPEIQNNFGAMILEFIYKALCHPMAKIQYKAALCIVNFEQGIAQEPEIKVMEPYLQGILGRLAAIFENAMGKSNYIMLEGVLESIASIASSNPFIKYYSSFMPGLIRIVNTVGSETPQKVNIKAKAIEAMGDLLSSIRDNRELFMSQCNNIMVSLISLQQQIHPEDTLHRAIFSAYEEVVEVLKQDFSAYSDSIFKFVHDAAARRIDVQIIDQMETQKQQETSSHKYVKVKLDLKIDGVKNLVLNTDTFEQKVQATSLLSALAEHMGTAFGKYVNYMYPLIQDLIIIKNSKEMRGNMIDCCKFMVVAAATPEQSAEILTRTFPLLKKALSEAIRAKDHSETASITEAMSLNMPFMNQQMISDLPDIMMAVLGLVKNLSNEIEKIYAEKEMDDDLTEQMTNETDEVEQPLEYVEAVMKQARGVPVFDKLKQFFPKDYEFDMGE